MGAKTTQLKKRANFTATINLPEEERIFAAGKQNALMKWV